MNLNRRMLIIVALLIIIPTVILIYFFVPKKYWLIIVSLEQTIFSLYILYIGRQNKPKTLLDKYSYIKQTLRRKYILFWLSGLIGTFTTVSIYTSLAYRDFSFNVPSIILLLLLLLFFIPLALYGIGSLVTSRYFVLMGTADTNADERELQNKDKAFRIAFQFCLLGGLALVFLSPLFVLFLNPLSITLPWGLILLVASAPTLVYAWLEPDPIPDSTLSGEYL